MSRIVDDYEEFEILTDEVDDDISMIKNDDPVTITSHKDILHASSRGCDDAGPSIDGFVCSSEEIVHFIINHTNRRRTRDREESCDCLSKHEADTHYTSLYSLIQNCQRYISVNAASGESRFDVLRTMLSAMRKNSNKKVTATGSSRALYGYYIGGRFCLGKDHREIPVCVDAFRLVYHLSLRRLSTLQTEIRESVLFDRAIDLNECVVPVGVRRALSREPSQILVKTDNGYEPRKLTMREIGLTALGNSTEEMSTAVWLTDYFELVGDRSPDSELVELEPQFKSVIYKEYCAYMTEDAREKPVAKSLFYKIWRDVFPYVRVRPCNSVQTEKCRHCALLADLRMRRKPRPSPSLVSQLHVYHRRTYMGERAAYYERRQNAIEHPDQYMSVILSGMTAQRTELPYLVNEKFNARIFPRLQGALEHGQFFTIYRTFGNVLSDANLAIHCLLLSLERRVSQFGRLPPTVFIQIDGGSKNVNKWLLAMCEFIVALRLTQCIHLTQLPVEHSHEDIDSMFGTLWEDSRQRFIITPQGQRRVVEEAFSDDNSLPFRLEDVFVVGDYQEFFQGCIDPFFAYNAKGDYTQHSWRFEGCARSRDFPLGVKTTYKAYMQDKVVELIPDDSTEWGIAAATTYCRRHPVYVADTARRVEGMYILQSVPSSNLKPAAFVPRYVNEITEVMEAVRRSFGAEGAHTTKFIDEWEAFKILYPSSMNSTDYPHYFKIPLERSLFRYLTPSAGQQGVAAVEVHLYDRPAVNSNELLYSSSVGAIERESASSEQLSNRNTTLPYTPPQIEVTDGRTSQHTPLQRAAEVATEELCNTANSKLRTLKKKQLEAIYRAMRLQETGKKDELVYRLICDYWFLLVASPLEGTAEERNAHIATAQLFVQAVHQVANIVDPRVEPFRCRISPCKRFVEPFVTKVAIIQALMEALQKAQVDLGEFPCNKKYVSMIVKSYYRDMLGLGLVDNVSEDESKYSGKKKRELKGLIRRRSLDDFLFGQKLIRLPKVGSADSRIEPDGNLPFLRCWYGGPYSLANRVITYMQDCGVACEALRKAILEFDELWPLYIRDMISTAIVVNEMDYNRAVSGAIRDEKLKELDERIRASSPDCGNASSVAGDMPGDRSSPRTPLPAIPQGVLLAAGNRRRRRRGVPGGRPRDPEGYTALTNDEEEPQEEETKECAALVSEQAGVLAVALNEYSQLRVAPNRIHQGFVACGLVVICCSTYTYSG
eukprot:gene28326-34201_t